MISIIGAVGGFLGIITFFKVINEKEKDFNKLLFYEKINLSYSDCFDDKECTASEYIDLYNTYKLQDCIVNFVDNNNSFKGHNLKFSTERIYAWALKIKSSKGHWHNLLFEEDRKARTRT